MSDDFDQKTLILGSASKSRQSLMKNAGLDFKVAVSDIDESIIKKTLLPEGIIEDLPVILAQAKASAVSKKFPSTYVIGSDQILVQEQQIFDKPVSEDDARDQLLKLRGKQHRLETAVCVTRDDHLLWAHSETAYLKMREFSLAFLGNYLAEQGAQLLTSVGGYKIEGTALQMFESIEGDFFSILGLPMIPLLNFLRQEQILDS